MALHVFNILNAHLLFPHIFVYFVCVFFFFFILCLNLRVEGTAGRRRGLQEESICSSSSKADDF